MKQLVISIMVSIVALVSSGAKASTKLPSSRPNILWLIAEDLGTELACYGTREVWTPHLDKLAAEGTRYTHCYSCGPVCSVSRSSFMTGMYATTIGSHNHRTADKKPLPNGVRLLSDWMRDAGYFTANIKNLPPSFGFKGTSKMDWNFKYKGKAFDSSTWDDLKTHQPFYAQINFQETHRSFKAPVKADPDKVEFPSYYPDHSVTRQDWAKYLDSLSELDRKIGLVLQQLEKDGLADNTIVIFFGDNGQAHVRGKQFCYESGLHVPLIIRWARKIPAPAKFTPGSVDARLINLIDLAPTMIDIAGGDKPPKMEGCIFLGDRCTPNQKYVFGSRDRCDETVMSIRTVRDRRYRYIRNFTPEVPLMALNAYKKGYYPVWDLIQKLHTEGKLTQVQEALCQSRMPSEELYDLETDPYEVRNLSSSTQAEHQESLIRLRGVLEKWIADTHEQSPVSKKKNDNTSLSGNVNANILSVENNPNHSR